MGMGDFLKKPSLKSSHFYEDLFFCALGELVRMQDHPDIKLNERGMEFSFSSMVALKLRGLGFELVSEGHSKDWKSYINSGKKLPEPTDADRVFLEACGLALNADNIFSQQHLPFGFALPVKDPKALWGAEANSLWEKVVGFRKNTPIKNVDDSGQTQLCFDFDSKVSSA